MAWLNLRNKEGLERIPTTRDGKCQFLAFCFSASIPVDHHRLRTEIVGYMQTLPELFGDWFDNHFQDYQSYCSHMARDGSWGDEVTLQAAAHLMMRPTRVISDIEDADREFSPPQVVSEDVWGPPVCLAYTGSTTTKRQCLCQQFLLRSASGPKLSSHFHESSRMRHSPLEANIAVPIESVDAPIRRKLGRKDPARHF